MAKVSNILVKGEFAHYEYVSLLQHCFRKTAATKMSKASAYGQG